jgi:hypothetical protein
MNSHEVVSSQLIYKFECLEIILSICKSLLNNTVFFCFTRRNFKSKAGLRDESEKPSSEYSFFFPREVGRKLIEELPATIDFIQHVLTKEVKNPSEGYFTNICERLIASSENREYYLGIRQSNQFGSYQIYLSRHNLYVQPIKVTDFSFTPTAARALMGHLQHLMIAADSLHESQLANEPKTIPLERATTDTVLFDYFVLRRPSKWRT